MVLAFFAARSVAVSQKGAEGWDSFVSSPNEQSPTDRAVTATFLSQADDEKRYAALFRYFVSGAAEYARGASVYYTGFPSKNGYTVSGVEGFARIAPLMGAWIHSGRPQTVEVIGTDRTVNLVSFLRDAVVAGTDPESPHYWGDMEYGGQRNVEAPDIARMLWLTRPQIWDKLDATQRERIVRWLKQSNTGNFPYRSNWLLFPAVVSAFLQSVGAENAPDYESYFSFKNESYLESGWFSDGPGGHVDYYNTWGISYDLAWIHMMDPDLDPAFMRQALTDSAELTTHLISPKGLPILGRSPCYRTAVPSPVIAGSILAPEVIPPDVARRALDATWRYFVSHEALKAGALSMGYFGDDPRLVDGYTGPGSCHWGLRSLTLAFMAPPEAPFWQNRQGALPVENADYTLAFPKLGWTITGRSSDQEIVVRIDGREPKPAKLEGYPFWHRYVEWFFKRPYRPKNNAVRYDLGVYSALRPLGGQLASNP